VSRIPPEHVDEIKDCFRTTSAQVHRYLHQLTQGDEELCDDLVQETFHKAAKRWPVLRDLTEKERIAWLIRVAHDAAIDVFRRNNTRQEKWPQVRARYQPGPPSVPQEAMTSIAIERFIKAIGEMPPERARVANLYWRCGWNNHEIAEALGITPGRVSQQIAKSKATLRSELDQYFAFESGEPGEEDR
jgi:RNA polymerase sigma-70 factor (ECF subfamily)